MHIEDSPELEEDNYRIFLSVSFPNLWRLSLESIQERDCDQSVHRLLRGAPRVTHLTLSTVDILRTEIDVLASHAAHLERLTLHGCRYVDSYVVARLAQQCQNLRYLWIDGTDDGEELDAEALRAFAGYSKQLEGIHIGLNVCERAVYSFFQSRGGGASLRYLSLDTTEPFYRLDAVAALGRHCVRLTELQFEHNSQVPTAMMVKLLKLLKGLRERSTSVSWSL